MAKRTNRGQAIVVGLAIGLPVGSEVLATIIGNGTGPIFQVGAVLGAVGATWLATRRGLWWLLPAQPLIVVPVAVAGTVLSAPSGTSKTKLGTDAATALQHAFLIALAALAAVALVGFVKAYLEPQRRADHYRKTHGARSTGGRRG